LGCKYAETKFNQNRAQVFAAALCAAAQETRSDNVKSGLIGGDRCHAGLDGLGKRISKGWIIAARHQF
jgi:hypothetical protein